MKVICEGADICGYENFPLSYNNNEYCPHAILHGQNDRCCNNDCKGWADDYKEGIQFHCYDFRCITEFEYLVRKTINESGS